MTENKKCKPRKLIEDGFDKSLEEMKTRPFVTCASVGKKHGVSRQRVYQIFTERFGSYKEFAKQKRALIKQDKSPQLACAVQTKRGVKIDIDPRAFKQNRHTGKDIKNNALLCENLSVILDRLEIPYQIERLPSHRFGFDIGGKKIELYYRTGEYVAGAWKGFLVDDIYKKSKKPKPDFKVVYSEFYKVWAVWPVDVNLIVKVINLHHKDAQKYLGILDKYSKYDRHFVKISNNIKTSAKYVNNWALLDSDVDRRLDLIPCFGCGVQIPKYLYRDSFLCELCVESANNP